MFICFWYIFRDGSVLAVDLGHLKVVSNLASRDTSVRVCVNELHQNMKSNQIYVDQNMQCVMQCLLSH